MSSRKSHTEPFVRCYEVGSPTLHQDGYTVYKVTQQVSDPLATHTRCVYRVGAFSGSLELQGDTLRIFTSTLYGKTNTNRNPDLNRYRRRCPDPGYTHFGTNPLRYIPTSVLMPNVAPTSVLMPTSTLNLRYLLTYLLTYLPCNPLVVLLIGRILEISATLCILVALERFLTYVSHTVHVIAIGWTSVHPSVRLSVTRWYCVKTAQPIVKLS